MNWKIKLQLRHDIYFALTRPQQRRFHSLGHETPMLEFIDMKDFLKITKNKDLIIKLIKLKRMSMRLVA